MLLGESTAVFPHIVDFLVLGFGGFFLQFSSVLVSEHVREMEQRMLQGFPGRCWNLSVSVEGDGTEDAPGLSRQMLSW